MISLFEKLFPNHVFRWNKSGSNAKGCCPFHNDKSPSLSIYLDSNGKQRWYCLAERFGGREIDAVLRSDSKFTRASANRWLINNGFLQETEVDVAVRVRNEMFDKFYEWSHTLLTSSPDAAKLRIWLNTRGVSTHVIDNAPIGFYPSVELVQDWVTENSIPEQFLIDFIPAATGASKLVEGGLIFFYRSAFDLWYRLKVRNPFKEGNSGDKVTVYLGKKTSKFSGFFSGTLDNVSVDKGILEEGEIDVLATQSVCTADDPSAYEPVYCFGSGGGIESGVAILTSAGIENLYMFPDNDGPGLDYAFNVANNYPYTYIIYPSDYQEGEDPGDWFLKHTFEDFLYAYRNRIPSFEWIGRQLASRYQNASVEDQARAKDTVLEYARKLSPTNREIFLRTYAPLTGVSYDSLWEEVQTVDMVRYRRYLDTDKFGIHMMVQKGKTTEYEPISNVIIEFTKDVVLDEGSDVGGLDELDDGAYSANRLPDKVSTSLGVDSDSRQERELVLRVTMPSKERVIRVTSSEYMDDKTFGNILMKEMGTKLWIKPRCLPYLKEAAAVLPSSLPRTEEVVYTHTGWRNGKFLMPNGYADITGFHPLGEIKVELPRNPPMFSHFKLGEPAADMEPILRCLRDDILQVFPYSITLPMLAHMFLAPLVRLDRRFTPYALWVQAITGSFKTTYTCLLASLYGNFTAQGSYETWRSTGNSLEKNGYYVKDCVYIVDDYKRQDVNDKFVTTLMQNYGSGSGRSRLRADQSQQKTWSIRGLLTITGEDIPVGEASVLARTIIVPIQVKGDTEKLTRGQKMARHLPGLLTKYIQYILEHKNEIVSDATFESIMQKSRTYGVTHQRIKVNLALNDFAWRVCSKFLGLEDLTPQYEEGMAMIAKHMDIATRSEQASNMYIDLTKELISSGEYFLMGIRGAQDTDKTSENAKRIGFITDDAVYLEGTACLAAVNALRTKLYGSGIKYSQGAIYDQLQSEGILVLQRNQKTGVIKVKGTTHRVIKIRRGVVEGDDSALDLDIDTDYQFKGSEVVAND